MNLLSTGIKIGSYKLKITNRYNMGIAHTQNMIRLSLLKNGTYHRPLSQFPQPLQIN